MLQEIVNELERVGSGLIISDSQVRNWMRSEDADILGATYAFLSNAAQVQRVSPPLPFEEVFHFMLRYYEFCFRNDPKSRWANSRYSAGWDLAGWFSQMWDQEENKKYIHQVKSFLERLFVTGTPELRRCIEHSVIEHLFEREPIRKFFEDWAHNPQLRPAYDEAKLWIERGGRSPLTEPSTPGGASGRRGE